MATQYVYPTADTTVKEWTPSTGTTHYALVDEEPISETDYISVNGFSSNKRDRFVMAPGVADTIMKVTAYDVELHLKGAAITDVPGMGVFLYLNGGLIGTKLFTCDTGGVYEDVVCTFSPLNIDAALWYAGPIEVEVKAINGSVGYEPIPSL